jgi:hypothetical protein
VAEAAAKTGSGGDGRGSPSSEPLACFTRSANCRHRRDPQPRMP